MSAFEFLISFYGLLLGLSIAELAGGFSRVWDGRERQRIGWLAPLLGLILLADLVSFWTNTWYLRDRIEVSYLVAFGAAIVNLAYYFAATQVFPRDGSMASPDDHVMSHRKAVVAAAILSNVLVTVGANFITETGLRALALTILLNIPLFVCLAAIGWLPGRRAVLAAMLVTLPFTIFYEPTVRWFVGLFL